MSSAANLAPETSSSADAALTAGLPATQRSDSPRHRALRRFLSHRLAIGSLAFILCMTVVIFPLAPIVAPIHPHKIDLREVGESPSRKHLMGTDLTGRDVWSRLVYGGRVSISVGLVAVLIYTAIGLTVGCLSGYLGGSVDALLMRITDTVMAFPVIVILISVVAIVGPGLFNSMLAIGFIGWTGIARLTRGQILSVREMDFVLAAQAVGVPRRQILVRHVLPSIIAPVTVAASFGMAGAILTEAALSFLGLGVQIPIPSWGNMLNQAQSIEIIEKYVWLWIPPGLMISITVLSVNFIGDGLRDALDPRMTLD